MVVFALTVVHGGIGENGTLQEVLEASGVPYTGNCCFASRPQISLPLFQHAFAVCFCSTAICSSLLTGCLQVHCNCKAGVLVTTWSFFLETVSLGQTSKFSDVINWILSFEGMSQEVSVGLLSESRSNSYFGRGLN